MRLASRPQLQSTAALIGAALGLLTSSVIGPVMVVASEPPDSNWRLMLVVVFAVPYVLGLATAFVASPLVRGTLLLGAALAAVPSAATTYSLLALPFLAAAIFLVVAGARTLSALSLTPGVVLRLIVAAVGGVAIYASIWVLFASDDPRCIGTATGTACSSDVVTAHEAAASLALMLAGVAVIIAASLIRLRSLPASISLNR